MRTSTITTQERTARVQARTHSTGKFAWIGRCIACNKVGDIWCIGAQAENYCRACGEALYTQAAQR